MTTMTYEQLTTLANEIKSEDKKANAVSLLARMQKEIHGIGDRPIRWSPSFVSVVQGTTDTTKFSEKVSTGDIVWGTNVIGSSLKIIPMITYSSRTMWNPDITNAKVLCYSPDANEGSRYGNCRECQFSKFDEANNKVPCTLSQVFWVIKPDFSDIGQVSFSKTNYTNGTGWLKRLRQAKVDPYYHAFELVAPKSTEHKNVYMMTAKPLEGRVQYTLEELAFIGALSSFIQEGRAEMVKAFKERSEERSHTPLLDGSTEAKPLLATETLNIAEAESEAPEAAKYDM